MLASAQSRAEKGEVAGLRMWLWLAKASICLGGQIVQIAQTLVR